MSDLVKYDFSAMLMKPRYEPKSLNYLVLPGLVDEQIYKNAERLLYDILKKYEPVKNEDEMDLVDEVVLDNYSNPFEMLSTDITSTPALRKVPKGWNHDKYMELRKMYLELITYESGSIIKKLLYDIACDLRKGVKIPEFRITMTYEGYPREEYDFVLSDDMPLMLLGRLGHITHANSRIACAMFMTVLDGVYYLTLYDLASRSGVWVDGVRIPWGMAWRYEVNGPINFTLHNYDGNFRVKKCVLNDCEL